MQKPIAKQRNHPWWRQWILYFGLPLMILAYTYSCSVASTPESLPQEGNILVLGDSLSAAYGIAPESGWVALLQTHLQEFGYAHQVVNASISGETTGGGLVRLPALLRQHRPVLVLVELGGNDGLRGLPPVAIRNNLAQILQLTQEAGAQAMLLGIYLPPNYGEIYTQKFANIYPELANQYDVPVIPFILAGIADQPESGLMQEDGIHPTQDAQPKILDNIWPHLHMLLP
ncbi:acyl-CoA thioesterase-1 [Allopseudospirillum japonicum]|uniref:Acyl-CoA thioesterase-1 n=1 Tax=Allopseudospirillum japonicum TaxID=64971 RepID=A0A1H6SUT4_9GAMM|nr:arylesterase [Allopseudospirillum japonicum]SEI71521.1 acyl-CoA thioesterase-1 [Allopseudospirillum japonicum]